jgi:hypothetical protein
LLKAFSLALALPAAAVTLCAPAAADDDSDFLQTLAVGKVDYDSAADMIRQAHVTCRLVGEGTKFATIQKALQQTNYSFSFDDSAYFIGLAVNVYCPQYKSVIESQLGMG